VTTPTEQSVAALALWEGGADRGRIYFGDPAGEYYESGQTLWAIDGQPEMTPLRWAVELDGETFAISSRTAALQSCEMRAAGGFLISPDGERTKVEYREPRTVQYQALGCLGDGPT
jgi:hypothetical protein